MKENSLNQAKERRRYPAQTITDMAYADDIALLANTSARAESLLRSQERIAAGIALHVNADKTEYMYFNQIGDLHIKGWSSETSGQVHLPRKQRLINRDRHHRKGMNSYR